MTRCDFRRSSVVVYVSIGEVVTGWVWVLLKIGTGSDGHGNKPETKLKTHSTGKQRFKSHEILTVGRRYKHELSHRIR